MYCKPQYCSKSTPKDSRKNWMSFVNNKNLAELTIPGTHDSGTYTLSYEHAKTQTWSIKSQLVRGIRYLDVRCRHTNNKFAIHHGTYYCEIMFGDVINDCISFLKENPTEVIIMRIKEEYSEEKCNRSFTETFTSYYEAYKTYMVLTNYIPNLDEVRGKIWVLRNFLYNGGGWNYSWNKIQDDSDIPTLFHISGKCDKIKSFLMKAISGPTNYLYINHCSGVGALCFPSSAAMETNCIPMTTRGRLGIIVMDYPGEGVIDHLISCNW